LLIPFSVRMWLGSVTLSGLLLLSSLPTLASTQTTNIRPLMKPMLAASTIVPTGTYIEAVRQQIRWTGSPGMIETVSSSEKQVANHSKPGADGASPTKTTQTAKSTADNRKLVQVATSQQKVSRSESSDLLDHALSLQGVRYVFGGTSRSGFDCSGYTQYVFRGSGISLPRTASEQFRVGSSVSRAQLKSGDLVFFTTYASGASHVGIYIGGGSFISASNNGVSVSNLDSGYYASRYIGARRY